MQIERQTKLFLAHAKRVQATQQRWHQIADSITKQYRELIQQVRPVHNICRCSQIQDSALRDAIQRFERRNDASLFTDMAALERSRRIAEVRAAWDTVESLASCCAAEQGINNSHSNHNVSIVDNVHAQSDS